MRAMLIGAALLASAGGAYAAGHGGGGHAMGGAAHGPSPQARSGATLQGQAAHGPVQGNGRADYLHGFDHPRPFAGGYGFRDGRRFARNLGYGYGYGPWGFGGYVDAGDGVGGPAYGPAPAAFGREGRYGSGFGEGGWGPPAGPPFGLYNHSGEGAYAYGYNGYAETPALPAIPVYASYAASPQGGYAPVSYGVGGPERSCGC